LKDSSIPDAEAEYKKQVTSLADIKKSINQLKQLKNDLENNYNNLLRSVAKQLIKPSELK